MQEFILSLLQSIDIRYAMIASIVISIVIAVIGVIPSIVVTAANVAVFGVMNGFMLSFAGEVVGAQVSFYLYRWGFKKPIQQRVRNKWAKKLLNQRNEVGFAVVLQGRLIPFIPSSLVTFYAAVSTIKPFTFFMATLIGKAPALVLETLTAYGALQVNSVILQWVIVVVMLVILIGWLKKKV